MGKTPGSPKTGGRKKGTPNARTFDLRATLDQWGIEPLDEILKASTALPERDKIKIYLEILPYLYPKRKPTEVPPMTLVDYVEKLSMPDMARLHKDLEHRMGMNRPLPELSMEQLQEYKRTIDKLISHREILEELGDVDDA